MKQNFYILQDFFVIEIGGMMHMKEGFMGCNWKLAFPLKKI